jgi:hypothetical protein
MDDAPLADSARYTEAADTVIAGLTIRGKPVSRTQLVRWHRASFIPQPIQRHQAGVRGSTSWYPTGTRAQLQAFCALHTRERNLPTVAWRLWWTGYPIPIAHARTQLAEVVTQWQQEVGKARVLLAARDASEEGAEAFDQLLLQAATGRTPRKVIRQARQRLGRERFTTFVRVALEVATGSFAGFYHDPEQGSDADERQLVEAGLGLSRARTDRLLDLPPWLPEGAGEVLSLLSQQFRQHPLGEGLVSAPEAELTVARNEVKLVLSLIEAFMAMAQQVFGRQAFGLGALAQIIHEMTPPDQARFLVLWRTLRTWGLGAGMDTLVATARQWVPVGQPLSAVLQQLAAAVPGIAEALTPLRARQAFRSPEDLAAWHQTLRETYAQHQEAIDAFVAAHPEAQRLLQAPGPPPETQPGGASGTSGI